MMRDIFFLSHGGGVPFVFFFRFFFHGYKWYILSQFIADCLLVFFFFFFWNFTFVMKAPSCRVCDVGVYRGSHGRSWYFFFLCRKDPGATQPPPPPPPAPPNILKNWCNMPSETILADWTFVFYQKVFGGGGGAIYGRRILMIRELLSCNFWGISTILKVQGTSREIILRLLFFGKLRARVSCIL